MLSVVVAGIVGAAAVVTALGVLSHFFGLGEIRTDFKHFLKDWKGEPARPGFAGRPSFPERMTAQEQRSEKIDQRTADLNHDLRGEVTSRLIMLEDTTSQLKRNGGASLADAVHRIEALIGEVKDAAVRTDGRVTEHRRRQDEAIERLREYITERLNTMEISQAQMEAMRASLHELGIDVQPPEVPRA